MYRSRFVKDLPKVDIGTISVSSRSVTTAVA
jgi:hypothetical protein